MPEMTDLEVVDASNTTRWPEGMLGGQINNAARALEGILARWYSDTDGSIASTGSANAYAITSTRTIAALVDNTVMAFTANFANTGAATLALNGLTEKNIKRPNGDALVSGDIASGQVVIVIYKSSPDEWRMLSPPAQHIIPARAYDEYGANEDLAGTIPQDDTVPQNTEGNEILSASITLKRSTSRVRIRFQGFGGFDGAAGDDPAKWIAALFIDSVADAAAATIAGPGLSNQVTNNNHQCVLEFEYAPASVGPFTYAIRVGSTGTMRMNGSDAARLLGGVARATLTVEEVFV
jgi:hypothetical protein